MQISTTKKSLKEKLRQWRQQGESIAFVPTMGNLHEGHIKLMSEAKKKADKVVASIFVNPMQFGENEDFDGYPRTEQADEEKLTAASVDLLFLPPVSEMYPEKSETTVTIAELAESHCGKSRKGHFDGVATVVAKLFNLVQPDMAFFGEKDFQQLLVIRKMVEDLNIPIKIFGVEIVRESDGLAMSSRNGYLSEVERELAPKLYQSLCTAKKELLVGSNSLEIVEQKQIGYLTGLGFDVDYFSICQSGNLQAAGEGDKDLVILVAAKLGTPRLIDNIYFSR
ncbi:MAG: pantoate--beta-alanine ligase [Methylococcales bacterium]|nr:pantoate--beta-alanine ligase [Methylococcales bacterium]